MTHTHPHFFGAAVDKLPARNYGRERPRIMFHVGDVAIERALILARAAVEFRADAVLIVAPCIMKPATQEMLIRVIGC